MKWDAIERTRGNNDFSAGDAIVSYGQANGMQIKGHALIWHGSVPPWGRSVIRGPSFAGRSRTTSGPSPSIIADASAHGTSSMKRSPSTGRDCGTRVVPYRSSEINTSRMPSAWRARQILRRCSSNNDYGGEGLKPEIPIASYDLVQGLRAQGVPIDGGRTPDAHRGDQPADRCKHCRQHEPVGESWPVREHQRNGHPHPGPARNLASAP